MADDPPKEPPRELRSAFMALVAPIDRSRYVRCEQCGAEWVRTRDGVELSPRTVHAQRTFRCPLCRREHKGG